MLLLILILLCRVDSSCHCVIPLLLLWRLVETLRADRFALAAVPSGRVVAAVAAAAAGLGGGGCLGARCSMWCGGSVLGARMLALLAARFRMRTTCRLL
jgi:hypothetical protein